MFSGFYRVATVRQFAFDAPYGVSFPPLLPVLMSIWDAVAHSGVYAGTWINLIAAALTFPALLALGRRLASSDAPGIFATAALYGNPWYLDEVMGGRAIPIAVLLFVVLLLLLRPALTMTSRPEGRAAMAGVVAGLIVEARFDFLIPAIAIGMVLAAGKARSGTRVTPAYLGGLAAALAPWVAYSLVHFGVPFATDSTRAALSVAPIQVSTFVPFPGWIVTVRNAPFEWMASKLAHSWPAFETLAIAVGTSPVPVLAAMWAATRAGAQSLPRETTMVLVLAWIALAVQFGVTATMGYGDVRYWIAISTVGTFTIASALCNGSDIPHLSAAAVLLFVPAQVALMAATGRAPDRIAGILSCLWPLVVIVFVLCETPLRASRALARLGKITALGVPLLALAVGSLLAARATGSGYRLSANATTRTLDANTRILDGLDGADHTRVRILLAAAGGTPLAGEFGARSGIANVVKPAPPFGWVDLWLLVHRYGITHVVAGDPELDARLPVLFAVRRSANGALWAIEDDRPGLIVVDESRPAGSIAGLGTLLLVTNAGPVEAATAPPRSPDEWPYPLLLVPR